MTVTIAGIVAALGVLFGLNFFGLFFAAYLLDRTARHILWYLGSVIAFIVSGIAFALASSTQMVSLYLTIDDLSVGLGFVLLGIGLAYAFDLPIKKRVLIVTGLIGLVLVPFLTPRGEIDTIRLIFVSIWHTFFPLVIAFMLFTAPRPTAHTRFLGVLLLIAGISIFVRPVLATVIKASTTLEPAAQIELYGAVAGVTFIVPMLGIAAGLFFQVMSGLVTRYRNASITDSLTGLLNRRGFLEAVEDRVTRPAALIMIDIDRFKSINDTFGHHAGDDVLVEVARIIGRAAPEPHLAGRLGGEEFAVLLTRSQLPTATALAQSIRTAIAIELDGYLAAEHTITASLGVAEIAERGIDRALIDADHALYDAKNAGRNRVRVADGTISQMGSRSGARRAAS